MLLVLAFMIIIYRRMGVCACFALLMKVALVLLISSAFRITLTLPGIAGLILSMGMAVDANVVVFERIREELAAGKTIRAAQRTGYRRALPAVIDGEFTTLIAGIVLFWMGTGPIMGFAQMLIVGIFTSMFTALVITRLLAWSLIDMGLIGPDNAFPRIKNIDSLSESTDNEPPSRPIVEKRRIYYYFSLSIMLLGIAVSLFHFSRGNGFFNLGVEFSPGTSFTFDIGQPFDNAEIEAIVRDITGESAPQVQQILGTTSYQVMIRTTRVEADTRWALVDTLSERFDLTQDDFLYTDVSPTVSRAMQRSAIIAMLVASICMLIYITIRFRDLFTGISAVLAQIHDAFVVLCLYVILRIPLNYAFIAVMLTTLGYSINATIIIFDRLRENRGRMPKATDLVLMNTSITQTLRRTLYSTISSFLAVLTLYIIGVAAIRDFTLPIMVGLLFGAYSSVCLSGSTWYAMVKNRKADA